MVIKGVLNDNFGGYPSVKEAQVICHRLSCPRILSFHFQTPTPIFAAPVAPASKSALALMMEVEQRQAVTVVEGQMNVTLEKARLQATQVLFSNKIKKTNALTDSQNKDIDVAAELVMRQPEIYLTAVYSVLKKGVDDEKKVRFKEKTGKAARDRSNVAMEAAAIRKEKDDEEKGLATDGNQFSEMNATNLRKAVEEHADKATLASKHLQSKEKALRALTVKGLLSSEDEDRRATLVDDIKALTNERNLALKLKSRSKKLLDERDIDAGRKRLARALAAQKGTTSAAAETPAETPATEADVGAIKTVDGVIDLSADGEEEASLVGGSLEDPFVEADAEETP